jgi:hypothetical protein
MANKKAASAPDANKNQSAQEAREAIALAVLARAQLSEQAARWQLDALDRIRNVLKEAVTEKEYFLATIDLKKAEQDVLEAQAKLTLVRLGEKPE